MAWRDRLTHFGPALPLNGAAARLNAYQPHVFSDL